jgi:hypothetical protein
MLSRMSRPRIDLDGVTLHDESNPFMPLALFRYRTVEGLTLLVPESAEVLVEWKNIEHASIDLASGEVRLRFRGDYVAKENWLRGAKEVVGDWLDRFQMSGEDRGQGA